MSEANIHASCIALGGRGVLLLGPSGSGKSDLALRLIDDELEGLLGKDFNDFIEDDFKIEDMRTAIQNRAMER